VYTNGIFEKTDLAPFFFFFFSVRVLATLTADVGRILSKLHQVQPNGVINFPTGIRIAHVIYNFYDIKFILLHNK